MAQFLFDLMLIFITSAVKTVAKVLVKGFFDKNKKATLTSRKRNNKGGKSNDV